MQLAEIQRTALELSEADRAALAAVLLESLPIMLVDADDGVSEALRRSRELDQDSSMGCSWADLKEMKWRRLQPT
jgi:hypothetical protein